MGKGFFGSVYYLGLNPCGFKGFRPLVVPERTPDILLRDSIKYPGDVNPKPQTLNPEHCISFGGLGISFAPAMRCQSHTAKALPKPDWFTLASLFLDMRSSSGLRSRVK